ncbi:MAG: outer membrane protein assembly factor BamA [Nitrospirota bacterium]
MTARARGVSAALIWAVFTWPSMVAADSLSEPGQFQGRAIVAIELQGPTAPDRATFERVTRIQPGRAYSAAAIRRAIAELAGTGDWSDIRVSADPRDGGVALTIAFVPRIRISRVQFHGHRQSAAELRKAAGLRPGDELIEADIGAAKDRVRAWYERSGYIVDITADVALEESATRARVTFAIQERDRLRLRSITFPGTPAFSKFRHWIALRTAPGEYVSRDHLEQGLDRLRGVYRDAGYLNASIGPIEWTTSRRGIEIAVPIQKGTHYRVDIEGETGVGKKALKKQMTFFDDPRDDEEALAEEGALLARFLTDRGYRRAAVRMERHVDPDGTVVIRVVVDAGEPFPLREVVITGNIAASDAELSALLATRPSGFWRDRYAEQETLDGDRQRILLWYRGHGFLSPHVATRVEDADDPPRATAVFAVEEGPQTRINRVEIEGQGAISLELILQRYELQEGAPYVEVRLRAARTAMLEAYSELGYVHATVDTAPTISPDHTRADLRITIDEGLAVKVGSITLSGNERTRDHVILRELTIKPGDPYNPQQIFENQRRVSQLGFLREVRLAPTDPERQEAIKDLRLSVRERDAGMVDLGVGYSNYEGMRGFAEITYRNLMGLGRRAGLRLEGSRIERKATLSYRHPWLFNRRIDGKAALYHEVREEETRGYQLSAYGFSAGVDRTLRPRLFGSLVYDYQINHFEELTTDDPQFLPFDEDRANIGSLTPSLVWNTRDDLFNPRTGVLATVAFETAALLLGSQEQYWKVTAGTSRFIPVATPLVLALGTRFGVASRFGETREALIQEATQQNTDPRIALLLPPNERFYVGGRSSIRGYEEDTVGPKLDDGTPTGGNVFLLLNAELRATVVGSLGVVVFWDGGNTWLDQDSIRWTDIKTTVGMGVRYNTPVGPLRLDYGHKLNWEPGEAHGTYHFTLGHAF